jgi:hypothetical protein
MAISGLNPKTTVIYTKATISRLKMDGTMETNDGNVTLGMDISDYTTGSVKVGFVEISL